MQEMEESLKIVISFRIKITHMLPLIIQDMQVIKILKVEMQDKINQMIFLAIMDSTTNQLHYWNHSKYQLKDIQTKEKIKIIKDKLRKHSNNRLQIDAVMTKSK